MEHEATADAPVNKGGRPRTLPKLEHDQPLSRFFINLSRHMRRHGHTVQDVIAAAGCSSHTTFFKWRRGGNVSERHLSALAKFYGTNPSQLRYAVYEVDNDTLENIIETLEHHLREHGVHATPRRKAKLISHLYEEHCFKPEPLPATVPRLIEAATA